MPFFRHFCKPDNENLCPSTAYLLFRIIVLKESSTIHIPVTTMAGKIEFYKCAKCGEIIEKDYAAGCDCTPVCCGEPMVKLEAQTADPDENKHVPYIEKVDGGVLVKVGKSAAHPMEPDHYIVFIEICADGILMRKYLKPGDKPEAFFKTDAKKVIAWELCNKHGIWTYQ